MRLGYDRRRIAWFGTAAQAGQDLRGAGAPDRPGARAAAAAAARAAARPRARALGVLARADPGRGEPRSTRVPPLEKAEMMARYDDLVTDPNLRRDELLTLARVAPTRRVLRRPLPRHDHQRLLRPQGPVRLRPWRLVRDRRPVPARVGLDGAWRRASRAGGWRCFARRARCRTSARPAPRRSASASIACSDHRHPPDRGAGGGPRPLQPQFLDAQPSAAMRLAEEQETSRLRLSLTGMSTTSELRSPAMTERLTAAFGVQPFDVYATTEGCSAPSASATRHPPVRRRQRGRERRRGRQALPTGTPGTRVLVTNLPTSCSRSSGSRSPTS